MNKFFFFMRTREMNFIFILMSASILLEHGVGVGSDEVSVSAMEGDSVTLYTGVERDQQEKIKWYFNDTRIAQINGDLSCICTDVQCNKGTERFRDRLKLDHQTGSLTIMNITGTDSGEYELKIISIRNNDMTFNVSVHAVPDAVMDTIKRKSVKKGKSVTFDSGEIRKPKDLMTWYFNGTFIAKITGDPSKTCTDVQCNESTERFRDRLKLDHQTGSLTIMNITDTDCGEYELQIISNRCRIIKSFVALIDSHVKIPILNQPSGGLGQIEILFLTYVLLLPVVVLMFYYLYRKYKRKRLKSDGESYDLENDTEIQRDAQKHMEIKLEDYILFKPSESTEKEKNELELLRVSVSGYTANRKKYSDETHSFTE